MLSYNRYGVLIPIRVVRTASGRHLLKRRILSCARQWSLTPHFPATTSHKQTHLHKPPGRDFLFIIKKDIDTSSFARIRDACENAKIRLIGK